METRRGAVGFEQRGMRAVKLIKISLLLIAPALALLLLGGVLRPSVAQAKPKTIITINPTLCVALSLSSWVNSADALSACGGLNSESNLRTLVKVLRRDESDLGNSPKPEEFASIDRDGGQIHETDGELIILAFVTNDEPVGFYADKGAFLVSGSSAAFCGPPGPPSFDFTDADCDDNSATVGDGVVAAKLKPNGASRGSAEVRVRQGNIEIAEPYKIVGEPHDISVTITKPAIQTGWPRCDLFSDTATYLAAITRPETSPFTAKITDDDGTAVTGAFTAYTMSNPDSATVALPLAPSLDLTATLGSIVAPNVLCGTDEPGKITVTGRIVTGPEGVGLDPAARLRDTEVEITVVGPPTDMALSASPSGLTCDGVASSTVSAALTGADGKPVIDGNRVHWEVKALGSANPLNSTTAAGAATTAVTPLDSVTAGVVVRAWVELPVLFPPPEPTPTPVPDTVVKPTVKLPPIDMARTDIERTILVACQAPAPAAGQQPGGPSPSISPPATGSGGSSTSEWWLALPLTVAALLLVGTGLVLKRRSA